MALAAALLACCWHCGLRLDRAWLVLLILLGRDKEAAAVALLHALHDRRPHNRRLLGGVEEAGHGVLAALRCASAAVTCTTAADSYLIAILDRW